MLLNIYPSAKAISLACAFLRLFLKKAIENWVLSFRKDPTKNQNERDLIYLSKYPKPSYNEDYLSKIGRRIDERTADRCRKDKQSHLFKHAVTSQLPNCETQLWNLRLLTKITMEINTKGRYLKLYTLSSTNDR